MGATLTLTTCELAASSTVLCVARAGLDAITSLAACGGHVGATLGVCAASSDSHRHARRVKVGVAVAHPQRHILAIAQPQGQMSGGAALARARIVHRPLRYALFCVAVCWALSWDGCVDGGVGLCDTYSYMQLCRRAWATPWRDAQCTLCPRLQWPLHAC